MYRNVLLIVAIRMSDRRGLGHAASSLPPRTANGRYYTADLKGTKYSPARSDQRRPTSTSSKSPGASRPTISARVPNTSWKARR